MPRLLPQITQITLDWKEGLELDELAEALKPFGVHVYEDPSCEGSDCYGFLFSKVKLTAADLREWQKQAEESY